jgi:nucleotide-binding universal stress UspA family protein
VLHSILVAFDGSDPAKRAFAFALELARRFGAAVTVLAVAQPAEPSTLVETTAMLDWATEHYEAELAALRAQAEEAGVPVESRIAVGHPAEKIVETAVAQGADLIVMGHRGRTRIREWLLGSVSKRVITYAPCSVTIVR